MKDKKQKQLEATKRWQAKNRDKVLKYRRLHSKDQWQKHYKKNREQILKKNALTTERLRIKVVNLYGGKCAVCGITDTDCLAIDHIKNDGYKTKSRSYSVWRQLLRENNKSKYQVLCHNHNWKKHLENLRNKNYGKKITTRVYHSH